MVILRLVWPRFWTAEHLTEAKTEPKQSRKSERGELRESRKHALLKLPHNLLVPLNQRMPTRDEQADANMIEMFTLPGTNKEREKWMEQEQMHAC
jgi:hypothetical protein